MELNIITPTETDIKALEEKYYGPGGELRDLAHLKGIGDEPSLSEVMFYPDWEKEDGANGAKGFSHQGRQEIFSHHTYDLIKRLQDEVQKLTRELEQQRFNNKHNLSIDQKISDEMVELSKLKYDLRIGKVHKREELIRVIDDKPYILDKDSKKGIVWCETIVPKERFKRFRPVTVEEALSRGFTVL